MGRTKKDDEPNGATTPLINIDDIEFTDEETKAMAQYFKIRSLDEASKMKTQAPEPTPEPTPKAQRLDWKTDTTEHIDETIAENHKNPFDFLKKEQRTGYYHTVYVIDEDYTISETRMRIKDSRLNTKSHDYIIENPPYKFFKFRKFAYNLVYFVSKKTGTTIDFAKIYAGIPQVDSKTMDDYFDKRAMRNMLGLYTRDYGDMLMGLMAGAALGLVGGMMI